jgi:hypothetical protein
MPRIRSIKPDFFRDGKLQDIQVEHPELNPMLVFAGLWTVADKNGVFEWEPRSLKLDILPFLEFDLGASLVLLERFSLISRFESGGKPYGVVINFAKHQRISGKEEQTPSRFPEKQLGSIREAPGIPGREGKGREMEGKGLSGEAPKPPPNQTSRMIEILSLPSTFKLREVIGAALAAEVKFTGNTVEQCSQTIANHALRARAQGIPIDKFWFEDTKWRNGSGRPNKADQAIRDQIDARNAARRAVGLDN